MGLKDKMLERLIIECEEVEQAPWTQTHIYRKEGWKCHPFQIQIDYPFGFRNPFCNVFSRKPRTLREVGIERFFHRQVLGWEDGLGSYGMGGPGFFGFSLSKTRDYPRECLVLTLWGAEQWILFDERPICVGLINPSYLKGVGQPLINYKEKIDEFSPAIIGSELKSIELRQDYSKFEFLKDSKYHKLEAPGDPDKLPRYGENCGKRVWNTDEHIEDAWIVTRLCNLNV